MISLENRIFITIIFKNLGCVQAMDKAQVSIVLTKFLSRCQEYLRICPVFSERM